ncbi:acetoin dehydrogenase dihydrolipoyllysine-residue acetyltransferase subunit [Ruegeria sp. 2012CJ41-6]|uniref:Acetoin dehydrogenase dihydrolipoyllysine-residue acetyltransferase subunit n=1 Tax=Ruegeria spongiae TaxID=2942209 RepID=A0ABT0Q2W4_9RHOB|nr:acetoin dehydrogenase dihydrolipoyllysine-residue acetyltransferase subunit [Ruegeria spongiae]MCL6284175.1 acetoin dehydrogenase dihydrolipoyllysine-residue acetyltransferase subunit [Ruegeria spongiae]
MPTNVAYPKASMEVSSGSISRWLVADGEEVSEGQIIFEVENDKAVIEIEASANGIIRELVPEGVEVEVGDKVAAIFAEDDVSASAKTPEMAVSTGTAAQEPAPPKPVVEKPALSRPRRGPNPTPLARRLASIEGLVLDGVQGTGPRGRVQKVDVLSMIAKQTAPAIRPSPPAQSIVEQAKPTTPAAELHARWLHRGDGCPVVLLHGFSGDLGNWRGFLAGTRQRWPVLALDLPGHGKSPLVSPPTLDAIAAMVEETLYANGVDDCVLAGHSFGAAVAARMAARRQVGVRGLCLFAPAGLTPTVNSSFTQGILQARSASSLRPWLETLVHDASKISETFVRVTEEQRQNQALTQSMQAIGETFFADGTQCFSIRQDLADVRHPIRVVFGRQDEVLPFSSTIALPGHAALHALDRCGHMPHLEHPDLSFRILDELWHSVR